MDRLTKRSESTIHANGVCCTHFNGIECHKVAGNCACGCKWEEEAWSKLANYEDAEEQGTLIKLPCKVGEFVYIAKHGEKTRKVLLDSMSDILWEIEHGYAFGYTKEEAEQALAEKGKANE